MQISIILCTYNSSRNLEKTLDSILAQSFDSYEVVIIDGASKDSTVEIMRSCEERFGGKLKWISEKDNGVYDAMNKGIKIAKGDRLFFLGSGDIFYNEDVLKNVSEQIGLFDGEVVYGKVELENTGVFLGGEFSTEKLIIGNIPHQAIFYKKNIFNIFGLYDTRYKTLADWVFNMQWFNSPKIRKKYIDIAISKFELDGISKTTYDKNFYADFENNLNKYFSKESLQNFGGTLKFGYALFKNESFWRFWKWKNRVILTLKNPKYFFKKYFNL